MNKLCTSNINGSTYEKETCGFITVLIKFTLSVTIHSLKTLEWNADRDVNDYYDGISHEAQSSDFLHSGVKSSRKT